MRIVRPLMLLCLLLAVAQAAAPKKKTAVRATGVKTPATARRWMKSMTLHDRVAQLVFIPFHGSAPNARSREYRNFVKLIRDTRVGGLVLVNWTQNRAIQKAEPYALAAFTNRMQRLARTPLLVCGDFERGASMRVADTPLFPHAMAFGATGDPNFSRYEGQVTAEEARALGVQWLFYPVADVNNNPDNPIINIRSFGEDPQLVASHVKAFIEGARSNPKYKVLTTAKHFPGHGDTAVDSHLNMAVISADRERLDRMELFPFKAAIAAGVDAIMTAHIAVPALAPPDLPATLSPEILTTLLRQQLGFKGIIVTDALEMGGIAKGFTTGDAAVRALEAGADVLLMPPNPEAAIAGVLAAVKSGRITEKRVDESVEKILTAKIMTGLDKKRVVDLDGIGDEVDTPEAEDKAQEIAERAVTLVRNEGGIVPLKNPARTCFVVMPEGRSSTAGMTFSSEVRKRARRASVTTLDPSMSPADIDAALAKFDSCDAFALASFSAVSAYRGNTGLAGDLPRAINALIATRKPVAMVALGNPYLLRNFPNVQAYLATYSTVVPSEIAAVRALFGEIAITGHLPVSIPGIAKFGDGITISKK